MNTKDWIGKKFKYGATGPNEYDCYTFIRAIIRSLGGDLPEYASTDEKSLIHQLVNESKQVLPPIEKPEPFCIVLFSIHPDYVSHMGLVLNDCKKFIHIIDKIGSCIEPLNSIVWQKRIRGYLRWKN